MTPAELIEIYEDAMDAAPELRAAGFHDSAAGVEDVGRAAERELMAMLDRDDVSAADKGRINRWLRNA